jgi:very-short-patch-repair endonuclease
MNALHERANELHMKVETFTDKIKIKLQESNGPRENIYIKRSINEQKLTSVINTLGLDFVYNFKVPDTKLVADFYHKPSKTIIEVNGPSHYIKKFEGEKIVVSD